MRTTAMVPACAERLADVVAAAEPRLLAMPDATTTRRPAPGKWSPREIVGHLVDSASNNHGRFVRACWQDDLVCAGYAQAEWVLLQRYQEVPWRELVALWAGFNRLLAHVMASIPEPARTRPRARHNLDQVAFRTPPAPAEATLGWFMDDYVAHLEHHLRQVLGERWREEAC